MKKRANLATAIMVCVLLTVLAFAVAACGSEDETTTTTAAPTTTTAAAPGTTGGSATMPSLEMTPELETYFGEMQTLFTSLESLPEDSDPFSLTDVSQATDAQIKSAEQALEQIKAALSGLKELKPPAEIAAFQDTLVGAIASMAEIADKAIDAMKDKNQAAFDAAKAEGEALEEQMNTVLETLMSSMMGGMTLQ